MIAAQPVTHPPATLNWIRGSQKLMDRYLLTAKAASDAHLNDVLRGFLENTVLKMSALNFAGSYLYAKESEECEIDKQIGSELSAARLDCRGKE